MVKYVLSYDTVIDGIGVGRQEYRDNTGAFRYTIIDGEIKKIYLSNPGIADQDIVVDNGFSELVEKILNRLIITGKYSILKWEGEDPDRKAEEEAMKIISKKLYYGGETGVRKGHGYIGNSSPFPRFGRGQPVEGHEGYMEVDYDDKNIELVKYLIELEKY